MVGVANTNCVPTQQASFDLQSAASCYDTLQGILQAYTNLLAGNTRVVLRFGERWSEYQRGNADGLKQLYMTLYTQCPAAAQAGLPNLAAGSRVRRGPPAQGIQFFPRL